MKSNANGVIETSELRHTVNLLLGDQSGDGHGKTNIVSIQSNLDAFSVAEAYEKGVEIIGVDLINDVAEGYEDNTLVQSDFDKLVKHGFTFEEDSSLEDLDEDDDIEDFDDELESDLELEEDDDLLNDEEPIHLYEDTFVRIYLFIAKTGNPDFEYHLTDVNNIIAIGGYGLFE
jgi:hypothetical protein